MKKRLGRYLRFQEYLKHKERTDYKILIVIMMILTYGCVMIYSSSYAYSVRTGSELGEMLTRQFKFAIATIVAICIIQNFSYRLFRKRYIGVICYIISIGMIVLLKTPLGVELNGAKRWLKLGIQIQVIEVVKILLIIYMTKMIYDRFYKMRHWGRIVFIWIAMAIQAALILFISSNLSSAIILLLICFGMTFIYSKNTKLHLVVGGSILVVVLTILFLMWKNPLTEAQLVDYPYQIGRIYAFLHPELYDSDTAYQISLGLLSIGNGGVMGQGLGNGAMKNRLPESYNDMIFDVVCEELGVFGAICLVLLYVYLLYQIFIVIIRTKDLFGKILVTGIWIQLLGQVVMHIAVTTNSMPNTGVSLPFFSYGGSSMLFLAAEIGIVLSVWRRNQYQRYLLARKKRRDQQTQQQQRERQKEKLQLRA